MHQRGLHVLAYVSDQVKAKRKTAVARGLGAEVGGRCTFEKSLLVVDASLQMSDEAEIIQ